MASNILNSNSIAFIGIADEYCRTLENCSEMEQTDFIETMLKMLPRLYIITTDLSVNLLTDEEMYLDQALDEDSYEAVRQQVESVMGADDVYLDITGDAVKYSDTPVSASIAEGLADIFQVLFNFVATVRDTTDETVALALESVREDFKAYWSKTLLSTLRALNEIAYS